LFVAPGIHRERGIDINLCEKWGRRRAAPMIPQNQRIMSMTTRTNTTTPDWCWMSTTSPLSTIICIG